MGLNVNRSDTGGANQVFFVVRNDSSHSDVLFQTSDETWEAYNSWVGTAGGSGNSLYVYGGSNPALQATGRATKVSYNRPLTVDGISGGLDLREVPWRRGRGYAVALGCESKYTSRSRSALRCV